MIFRPLTMGRTPKARPMGSTSAMIVTCSTRFLLPFRMVTLVIVPNELFTATSLMLE